MQPGLHVTEVLIDLSYWRELHDGKSLLYTKRDKDPTANTITNRHCVLLFGKYVLCWLQRTPVQTFSLTRQIPPTITRKNWLSSLGTRNNASGCIPYLKIPRERARLLSALLRIRGVQSSITRVHTLATPIRCCMRTERVRPLSQTTSNDWNPHFGCLLKGAVSTAECSASNEIRNYH